MMLWKQTLLREGNIYQIVLEADSWKPYEVFRQRFFIKKIGLTYSLCFYPSLKIMKVFDSQPLVFDVNNWVTWWYAEKAKKYDSYGAFIPNVHTYAKKIIEIGMIAKANFIKL